MPDKQAFQRKLQAARELGLTVEETYTKIGNDYFQNFSIKRGDDVVQSKSFSIEKDAMLTNLRQVKDELNANLATVQEKIDEIKALDAAPIP